jgi:hypothetical protein
MAGVPVFSRDDVAFLPVQDLTPIPLGLIWKTSLHSTKIRALADTAWALKPLRVTYPPAAAGTGPARKARQ